MTLPVLVELAVGEPTDPLTPGVTPVSHAEAREIAAAAARAGVAALRVLDLDDRPGGAVEPTLVAAYLDGAGAELGYLVETTTTHQAPYNLARRLLSVDRAAGGRLGATLRPGAGDEVTAGVQPGTDEPRLRWAEYADVLARLWESFPREALVGDQEAAVVVDDTRLRPVGHTGRFYRVAGPLDGPASVQGRPVLAAVAGELPWASVARHADAVVVDAAHAVGADAALTAALDQVGRPRAEVALLGRASVTAGEPDEVPSIADPLLDWVQRQRLDGLVLVPTGGAAGTLATVRHLVPWLTGGGAATGTLRTRLGLSPVARPVEGRDETGAVA
jgi:alkanesulfonate monooxygenase SsuD/methylene tetrahydromethanopterin reductase-like flavin-dependent oxidoreductase (luciferase family)